VDIAEDEIPQTIGVDQDLDMGPFPLNQGCHFRNVLWYMAMVQELDLLVHTRPRELRRNLYQISPPAFSCEHHV